MFLSTNDGGARISPTVQAVGEAATLESDLDTKARAAAASVRPASRTELRFTGIQGNPWAQISGAGSFGSRALIVRMFPLLSKS